MESTCQLAQLPPHPSVVLNLVDYTKTKLLVLKDHCRDRNLPVSGTKAVLCARLSEYDLRPRLISYRSEACCVNLIRLNSTAARLSNERVQRQHSEQTEINTLQEQVREQHKIICSDMTDQQQGQLLNIAIGRAIALYSHKKSGLFY
jgi:hypothetical protein